MGVIMSTSGVVPRFLVLPLELTLLNTYGKVPARSHCHAHPQYCALEFRSLVLSTIVSQPWAPFNVWRENMLGCEWKLKTKMATMVVLEFDINSCLCF